LTAGRASTTLVVVSSEALTDLQLAVMRALWGLGEGTVAEVQGALARDGKELASTTVATLLQRLSAQGWIAHRQQGRQFVYRANVERKEAATGALLRLIRNFFDGDPSALAAHLVDAAPLSEAELQEMRRVLAGKEPS
jgi:BlaI family penicillinase repressor